MAKRKVTKKRKTRARKSTTTKTRKYSAAGGYDVKSRRKYDRGGRVEAYTFGEALKGRWP